MFFRGQTIGKYTILSSLGSGGFGTVYLAEDTWIDKKVALKVPHRQNIDFGELLREPRLLASLNHPNIVAILTAEKQDDVFFIVMEYVQGETLENLIARDGALELSRALDYTCQICNAVDHAHAQGVLHRDLRPANVLVSESGLREGGRLRHVAVPRDRRARHHGHRQPALHGARAVPGQGRLRLGHLLARRDDVPDADRRAAVRHAVAGRHRAADARRTGDAAAGEERQIPKEISDIVMQAMAPEISARYQRAGELLDDLLAARGRWAGWRGSRRRREPAPPASDGAEPVRTIRTRGSSAREAPQARFCWHCRKPLHARGRPLPVLRRSAVMLGFGRPLE